MADVSTISVLIRAKDEASKVLDNVQTKMGGMAAGFEKHRKSIGLGMTILGGALTAVSVSSIKAASDVEEMQGKFDTVFGELSKEVEAWAKTHADAANRNRFDLMEYASVLQDTFVPMGFARDKAAEFAKSVTELSVDLGSFNNLKTADVVRDMQSALVGNTETVRKYGVVITAASVETEIMNQGWASSKGEITEAMKVQARMNMIIAGTSDAQGDAIRTSGSFANQMLGLQASMKEAQVTLGQALLPAITALVAAITPVLISMANWMKENEGLAKVLILVGAGLGAVMLVLGPMLLILPQLFAGFKLMAAGIRLVTAAMAANPVGALIAILTTLAIVVLPLVIKNWDSIWGKILKITERVANFIIGILNKLTIIWRKQFELIATIVGKLLDMGSKLPFVGDKFKGAADAIRGFSDRLEDGIPKIDITSGKQEELQDAVQKTASEFEFAGSIIQAEQRKVGEAAEDAARVVGESSTGIGESSKGAARVVSESAEKMSLAWGEVEDAVMEAEIIVRESAQRQAETQAYFAQLNLDAERSVRDQSRADYLKWIEDGLAATKARQDAEAKAAQAISDSWSKFKQDQDATMVALKNQNISFIDVVEQLAIRHDTTVTQMADRLAQEGVRMNDTGGLVQQQGAESMRGLINEIETASQTVAEKMADMGRVMSGSSFTNAAGQTLGLGQGGMQQFQGLTPGEQVTGITGEAGKILSGANLVELTKGGGAVAGAAIDLIQGRWENDPVRLANEKILLEGGYGEVDSAIRSQARNSVNAHLNLLKRNAKYAHLNLLTRDMGTFDMAGSFGQPNAINIARQLAPQKSGMESMLLGLYASGAVTAFAGGGIVTRPTLGLVGEAGPEAVVPLGRGGGMGQTNNFHFHGAVYGVEDLKEAVVEAVRDHAISGGFSGVFAEA